MMNSGAFMTKDGLELKKISTIEEVFDVLDNK